MRPEALHRFLSSFQFPLSDEKRTQAEIVVQLEKFGHLFEREVRLGDGDIIDFMLGGTGLEVKLKGGKRDIYRQIERYCEHDSVTSLLLATNVPTGMPAAIAGKPIFVLNLGLAWL